MLVDPAGGKWIEAFAETFRLCGVTSGEAAAVLWESQSRPANAQLADLALQRLGARVFHLGLPTPPQNRTPQDRDQTLPTPIHGNRGRPSVG